jgi:hypothetical protein
MDTVPGLTFQQMSAAAAVVYFLMKWLKRQEWYRNSVKNFPAADVWAYRLVAAFLSLVTAVGINWAFAANPTTGGWDLNIAFPNVNTMWAGFTTFDWASIFGLQQLVYEGTRKPQEMPTHDVKASKKIT